MPRDFIMDYASVAFIAVLNMRSLIHVSIREESLAGLSIILRSIRLVTERCYTPGFQVIDQPCQHELHIVLCSDIYQVGDGDR